MIEIRTYDGDAQTISELTTRVWHTSFGGKVTIPCWDERYFEWQLLADRPGGRECLLAAYDGARLVGSLFAEPFRFRVGDQEVDGTMASWLTVDPAYLGHFVGIRLVNAFRKRHRERGARFGIGYGLAGTDGPVFWGKQKDTVQLGRVGLWVCLFDPAAVREWTPYASERALLRAFGPLMKRVPTSVDTSGIRPYRPDDLSDCLALAHGLLERADVGILWSRERLAHQLQYGDIPRTLVLERDGRVHGFVNFYLLEMLGREGRREPTGMVDLMAFGTLPLRDRRRLLRAAMREMVAMGATTAVVLRLPCYPAGTLWATGWLPLPGEIQVLGVVVDPGFRLPPSPRVHITCR